MSAGHYAILYSKRKLVFYFWLFLVRANKIFHFCFSFSILKMLIMNRQIFWVVRDPSSRNTRYCRRVKKVKINKWMNKKTSKIQYQGKMLLKTLGLSLYPTSHGGFVIVLENHFILVNIVVWKGNIGAYTICTKSFYVGRLKSTETFSLFIKNFWYDLLDIDIQCENFLF